MEPAIIALLVVALVLIIVLAKSVTIVPQAQAKVIERLGRYSRTLSPGLSILVPFVDRTTCRSGSTPSSTSRSPTHGWPCTASRTTSPAWSS
jgi:regulator of protease activity HflC (stomatin/prohibitin superfamily)